MKTMTINDKYMFNLCGESAVVIMTLSGHFADYIEVKPSSENSGPEKDVQAILRDDVVFGIGPTEPVKPIWLW